MRLSGIAISKNVSITKYETCHGISNWCGHKYCELWVRLEVDNKIGYTVSLQFLYITTGAVYLKKEKEDSLLIQVEVNL